MFPDSTVYSSTPQSLFLFQLRYVVHLIVFDSMQPQGLQQARLPVLHYLLEFAQTHVPRVSDANQSSHPLLPSSPPALNLSHHQCLFLINWLFASGGQSIGASPSA